MRRVLSIPLRRVTGAILAVLIVVVTTWLGFAAAGSALAVQPAPAYSYTYDVPTYDMPVNGAASERGPPTQSLNDITYDPVDRRLHGTSARPEASLAASITAYAYSGTSAPVTGARTTTGTDAVLADGDSSSEERFGVATKAGDEVVEGIAQSRTYVELTAGGSIRNVGTNATHTEFTDNLTAGGWISRTSKDGAVQIFQRDGAKYVLRERAGSYGGWTADFTPAGAGDVTLKIRLGYTP